MPNKAQEDAVINLKTLQEISRQLGFEWTVLASELGFSRAEIGRFHTRSTERSVQTRLMLESWYERSWDKPNKTKVLQDGLDRAGRRDLAEKLRCLHWGHQKLSKKVELPSAFPFIITVHKTISNHDALRRINDLSRRFT
ncbi:p53-induced death domain-containing protein 1 [Cyprinodon tularosa]|uniref:p53-induced death domain-containing protein 1-like n=1 Tax=Cyprinodon variegatus TaxID=28743 RepID=UPI000742C23C|nr:PREDICTED: p53-induced death domain-containing protein 1-like [Cyprinodon variegatus]XP_038158384.1 p53-induced death domain-containing protein 1 [Cyprinodon tularosa]